MIKEGVLNFYKPSGVTSNDCIYKLRKVSGVRKIGHTGTLDPLASGVLPLCIGGASRITEYLDLDMKRYTCTMILGLETDTLDTDGEVLADRREEILNGPWKSTGISRDAIAAALSNFQGELDQYPPKYSSVRIRGRHLYDYARAGEEVEIAPRKVRIYNIVLLDAKPETLEVSFDVVCSKGTYIRSLCRDVGEMLGTGACMSALERTASGAFVKEESMDRETLLGLLDLSPEEREARLNAALLSPDFPLTHFGTVLLNRERGLWFANGGHIAYSEAEITEEPEFEDHKAYKLYMPIEDGETESSVLAGYTFLGVAFHSERYKKLVADKVFYKKNESIQQL